MPNNVKTTGAALKEMKKLFKPPVLSSESRKAYDTILTRLMESIQPGHDFVMVTLVNNLAIVTWEIIRLSNHKKMVMERGYYRHQDKEAERHLKEIDKLKYSRDATLEREAMAEAKKKAEAEKKKAEAEKKGESDKASVAEDKSNQTEQLDQTDAPKTQSEYVSSLEAQIDEKIAELEQLVKAIPDEIDHADALQADITYYVQLDRLLGAAFARRKDVLALIDFYQQ